MNTKNNNAIRYLFRSTEREQHLHRLIFAGKNGRDDLYGRHQGESRDEAGTGGRGGLLLRRVEYAVDVAAADGPAPTTTAPARAAHVVVVRVVVLRPACHAPSALPRAQFARHGESQRCLGALRPVR